MGKDSNTILGILEERYWCNIRNFIAPDKGSATRQRISR